MAELTYSELADFLGVSRRHVRRIVARFPGVIQPLRYGANTVRFRFSQVIKLRAAMKAAALKGGRA